MPENSMDVTVSASHTFLHQFYDAYARFVYKLAWETGCPNSDVEDLVQEVWLRLCTKEKLLMEFTKERQLAYIATTVRNTAVSMARRRIGEYPLESAHLLFFDEASILNAIFDRQIRIKCFYEVWKQVPPASREILERKYVLLETDGEIAAALGIKCSSLRMYLTRARKCAGSILSQYKDKLI